MFIAVVLVDEAKGEEDVVFAEEVRATEAGETTLNEATLLAARTIRRRIARSLYIVVVVWFEGRWCLF